MASDCQLLFLYELESKVCGVACGIDGYHIFVRYFSRKDRKQEDEKLDIGREISVKVY
jgi:hypothetical protein